MDTLHAHLCHLQFLNTEDIWSAGPIHRCSIRELYQTEYIHPLFSRTSQSLQNHQAKKHKKEWVSGHAIIETQQQKRKGSLGRYVVSKYTVLFAYAETKIRRIWSFFFLLFCSLFFFFSNSELDTFEASCLHAVWFGVAHPGATLPIDQRQDGGKITARILRST